MSALFLFRRWDMAKQCADCGYSNNDYTYCNKGHNLRFKLSFECPDFKESLSFENPYVNEDTKCCYICKYLEECTTNGNVICVKVEWARVTLENPYDAVPDNKRVNYIVMCKDTTLRKWRRD